jgi:hypothetical protein
MNQLVIAILTLLVALPTENNFVNRHPVNVEADVTKKFSITHAFNKDDNTQKALGFFFSKAFLIF